MIPLLPFFLSRHVLPATILILVPLSVGPITARATATPAILDTYSNDKQNAHGVDRLLFDDKGAGGQSHATQKSADGILQVEGELIPGRGAPAFISLVSLLTPDAKPQDLTGYEGVRLRVKNTKGLLSVQVASTEVQNFDYHTSTPIAAIRGEFQEVRLPFKAMKRAWSEQTVLNLNTITSINLVSFAMARETFSYEVDEIGFY
ncbi:Complex I intermediate-associated protein 30 (CIA30) [Lacunisphaera limnophila]|uniref:Complex I intermediate-associated protein 30 (CIA30) n=1 Tax=Lacunisphaera limnophila TaxID=1838286 RepID=A0A1D8AR08_9BACT|nr:CIA30 family protein [Lacunisphaera limnophila]AOS43254.1 Complex I intermediate-associated protein 30 (CIA30) [Lacunisphaera limnophila]